MSLVTTPSVLLRSLAYGETSRILRFFTRDLGVVAVMAKGVRSRGVALRSFAGGDLTLYVRETRELQTFKEFTVSRARSGLGASPLRLGGAAVIGELVLRHAGEEGSPPLFAAVEAALDRIESAPEEAVLRVTLAAGWRLVGVLGYAPSLSACVTCGTELGTGETGRFDFPAGGVRCAACAEGWEGPRVGPGARTQLSSWVEGDPGGAGSLPLAAAQIRLLHDFVSFHVSGARRLESFLFLSRMASDLDA